MVEQMVVEGTELPANQVEMVGRYCIQNGRLHPSNGGRMNGMVLLQNGTVVVVEMWWWYHPIEMVPTQNEGIHRNR